MSSPFISTKTISYFANQIQLPNVKDETFSDKFDEKALNRKNMYINRWVLSSRDFFQSVRFYEIITTKYVYLYTLYFNRQQIDNINSLIIFNDLYLTYGQMIM